jgi:hypothetical protein
MLTKTSGRTIGCHYIGGARAQCVLECAKTEGDKSADVGLSWGAQPNFHLIQTFLPSNPAILPVTPNDSYLVLIPVNPSRKDRLFR